MNWTKGKVFSALMCVLVPGLCTFLYSSLKNKSPVTTNGIAAANGVYLPRSTIDLGYVWSGQIVQSEFTVTNKSDHAVQITGAKSDCGCTIPSVKKDRLEPGESTAISVSFNPPDPGDDVGQRFQRMVTADVLSGSSTRFSIALYLTGFLAPNKSFRAFPINVAVESDHFSPSQHIAYLHVKGEVGTLRKIPDRLTLWPGREQLVLIDTNNVDDSAEISEKDVELTLADGGSPPLADNWRSSIRFTPDSHSSGMIVHVEGHLTCEVVAEPESALILAGHAVDLKLKSAANNLVQIDTVETSLPLICDLDSQFKASGSWTLHIKPIDVNPKESVGDIHVSFQTLNGDKKIIAIPVVILNRTASDSEK